MNDERPSMTCMGGRSSLIILVCAIFMFISDSANSADDLDRLECMSAQNAATISSAAFEEASDEQLEKLSDMDTLAARAATRVRAERLERGIGGPVALKKALELYRAAAFVIPKVRGIYTPGFGSVPGSVTIVGADTRISIGDSTALNRLGEIYRDGIGVQQDAKRAQVYLNCAAKLRPQSSGSVVKQPSYFDEYTKSGPTPAPKADSVLLDRESASLSFSADVTGMAWSPDGKYLAVYYDKGDRLDLIRSQDGNVLWTLEKNQGFTSASQRVLQFSSDGTVLYLSTPVEKLSREEKARRQTDKFAAVTTSDGRVAHIVSSPPLAQGSSRVMAMAVDSHRGRLFAVTGDAISRVSVFDLSNWKGSDFIVLPDGRPEWGHGFTSSRLAFDPDREILWWAHEATIEALRASDARPLNQFHAFDVLVQAMQVNRRTGELVTGGSANSYGQRFPYDDPKGQMRSYRDDAVTLVRAFDPASGKQTRAYLGPGGTVEGLSVSADGKFIAAVKSRMLGTSSSYVLLWDAETGKLLSVKDCGSSQVGDVAFDPSGTRLAYARDQKIHIVNIGH